MYSMYWVHLLLMLYYFFFIDKEKNKLKHAKTGGTPYVHRQYTKKAKMLYYTITHLEKLEKRRGKKVDTI